MGRYIFVSFQQITFKLGVLSIYRRSFQRSGWFFSYLSLPQLSKDEITAVKTSIRLMEEFLHPTQSESRQDVKEKTSDELITVI